MRTVSRSKPTMKVRVFKAKEGRWFTPAQYQRKLFVDRLKRRLGLLKGEDSDGNKRIHEHG